MPRTSCPSLAEQASHHQQAELPASCQDDWEGHVNIAGSRAQGRTGPGIADQRETPISLVTGRAHNNSTNTSSLPPIPAYLSKHPVHHQTLLPTLLQDPRKAHLDIVGGHALRVGQAHGKVGGDADLSSAQVGVGGDDGAAGEVDALPHHVLAEQALLLLQRLPDALQGVQGLIGPVSSS